MTGPEFRSFIKPTGIGADTVAKGKDYGANTDWDKEITRTAISHVHNLSLSGGSQERLTMHLLITGGPGVAITTGFQQLNARMNILKKLLITANPKSYCKYNKENF